MSAYREQILIVEDDAQIRSFIGYALGGEGFRCLPVTGGQAALDVMKAGNMDLVLLDLGLPDVDGMEVIRQLRQWSEVPIIVVSARDQDREKAAALDGGADDYLTKPFSATELLARIRVALRHRARQDGVGPAHSFQVGELAIDYERRLVILRGEALHVTPMEYAMLLVLSRNAGKVLTTSYLLKQVWGVQYGQDTQALRALMAALRRKLEDNPGKPRYILTEVGVGYRLVDEP